MRRNVIATGVAASLLLCGCAGYTATSTDPTSPAISADRSLPSQSVPNPAATTEAANVLHLQDNWRDGLPVLVGHDVVTSALESDANAGAAVTTHGVAVVEDVPVFSAPDAGAAPVGVIPATTVITPTVLPVLEARAEWLLVPLLARSSRDGNLVGGQVVGWVEASTVTFVEPSTRQVIVDLSDQELTVSEGDTALLSVPVGVGRPDSPTPIGRTAIVASWVDSAVAYTGGEPVLATARFSDALETFVPLGTSAQAPPLIAFHAYVDGPTTGEVSNGCVRLTVQDHRRLVELAPVGTPVVIRP